MEEVIFVYINISNHIICIYHPVYTIQYYIIYLCCIYIVLIQKNKIGQGPLKVCYKNLKANLEKVPLHMTPTRCVNLP